MSEEERKELQPEDEQPNTDEVTAEKPAETETESVDENEQDLSQGADDMAASPIITPEKIEGDVTLASEQPDEGTDADADRENGIRVEYDLHGEEVRAGLHVFQKMTLYRRNWIYTAILTIIFGLYVIQVAQKPDYTLGYVLLAVCAGVIFMVWFLPYQHRKSTGKAVDLNDDRFSMTFGQEAFFVGEAGSCVRIPYQGKELVRVTEMEKQLVLSVGKERLFVLPRRCVEEETYTQIRTLLKEKLNANYMVEGQK